MKSIARIPTGKPVSRMAARLPDEACGVFCSPKERAVGFFCPDGTFGFAGDDGAVRIAARRLEVSSPVGACCDRWGIVVLQLSREMLWSFDQSYGAGSRMCGAGTFASASRLLGSASPPPYGMCRTSRSSVVVALAGSNCVAAISEGALAWVIGSGKRGFLSSSSPKAAMLDSPCGVCFDEGTGLIFVSDAGNAMVRAFRGQSEAAGVGAPGSRGAADGVGPAARLSSPSSIRSDRGRVALSDGNLVRTFGASSLDVSTPYASSGRVIDLAMRGDDIYVLEEL
jgi:hypothetical protein